MEWANLYLIVPGLAAEKLIASLSVRRERNQFEALTSAVVYSIVIASVAWILQLLCIAVSWNYVAHEKISWPELSLVGSGTVSISPIALIISTILVSATAIIWINHDGHIFFRKLNITRRQTLPDVWSNVFWASGNELARIELNNTVLIDGTIVCFDEVDKEFILIAAPTYYDTNRKAYPCPQLRALVRVAEIKSILFLEANKHAKGSFIKRFYNWWERAILKRQGSSAK